MHPLIFQVVVQQHIEGLRRDAELQRLRSAAARQRPARHRAPRVKMQRAPAH